MDGLYAWPEIDLQDSRYASPNSSPELCDIETMGEYVNLFPLDITVQEPVKTLRWDNYSPVNFNGQSTPESPESTADGSRLSRLEVHTAETSPIPDQTSQIRNPKH
jgi:hypothetical protein